ncbi:hypothetical protein JQU17_09390 [Ponticoccus sp. SC2-23]|uniref:hypothetical protein n=1 Tax=Alexandriicola marinus TaxID=2081710 RepID=UPI000FD88339|nr:hypothetical protein [Alexandriicola marinus]MBM1220099.1 hypothetical protein [Ponticoccus sp. SC6-9]MBM1224785.1 hypothetical protein [Ponticoccus sp. SC6-15]MBM1228298.1 hypothetical protein [Ponticoccus sp. SC6-38]MBM1234064.1 hypothetical protein [Ponticoccus sp. SC6-45]MBM1238800.1 hypothetical protein [Ponticoccus sp. SC6-49]MBM1242581.1 hypothetical protein [Ponticoccus sp. SC2-64]MBM1247588.1 hypothetical protein [Ponticoccus sp. SC6-42]MBM1251753.1 hypothetical protein [Pontico
MTHASARKLVKLTALLIIALPGIPLALAAVPTLAGPANLFFGLALLGGETAITEPAGRLVVAILGGVVAGWGTLVWLVADRLYARDPALAGSMLLISASVWFVIDSTASVIAGAPFNVVLNLLLAAVVFGPILLARRATQVAATDH